MAIAELNKQRISNKNDMEPVSEPSHGFAPGVKWRNRSALGPLDWICIALFWVCILAQLIAGFVIIGSRNYAFPYVESQGSNAVCPSGFVLAAEKCKLQGSRVNPFDPNALGCVDSKLCDELLRCHASLRDSSLPFAVLQAETGGEKTANNLWEAFGDYWYIPTVIFPSMVVLGVFWLLAMQYLVKPLVWTTITAGVAFLIGMWAYWYFVHEVNNWMLLVGAGITIIACIFLFRSINRACKVISVAAYGLRKTPWVIITSLMVKAIYVLYVVLWTIFMIRSAQAKSVKMSNCTLEDEKWIQVARIIYGLLFWIFTYVFLNMKTVVCAAGIGAWYFPGGDGEPTIPALRGPSMGLYDQLWGCHCFASCCLGVLEMFSKFMLIGQVFSGKGLCGAGRKSFNLVKDRLGTAFITDGVGHSMLSICTYVFSLGIGIAAWVWLDEAQNYQTLTELGWYLLIPVLLDGCNTVNQVHAQLAINSVTGALFIGSVCYSFFHFLADVMLSCIDTVFFCFAIEADADVYQGRFEHSVYMVLKEDMTDGREAPIYKGNARPLEEYEMAPVGASAQPSATIPAYSPEFTHGGSTDPTAQATIGYQGPVRPGGDRISYV
ncbi:hypothetical protein FOZ60_007043 [Perkinsus olseni]|uniref:Choline transporter-like protein n=2 Tax=Perkinsus olseni TaxID=32597 RepID=A0A7J6NMI6_PEROL|nr:hypothetical protein FOZ60_007043 [Perkinsus olseni]